MDIDPANISPALKLVYIGEFMVIIGCSLSKTCFAVTLLRTVTQKWQKMLLWWIIVSMNIVMGLCAILYLAQCQPTAHLWDFSIPAKCWDPAVMTYYTIAAGSKFLSGLLSPRTSPDWHRLFRPDGFHTCNAAVDHCLEAPNEASREGWRRRSHEPRCIVC